jgi:hypothetical protein
MKTSEVGTMRNKTNQAAKIIRKEIKAMYPDCKFSVTTDNQVYYSLITVSLLTAPFKALKSIRDAVDGYIVINKSLIDKDNRLTDEAKKVMVSVNEIINRHRLEDRLFRLEVGSHNKPFVNITKEMIDSPSLKVNPPITMHFQDRKIKAGGYYGKYELKDESELICCSDLNGDDYHSPRN